MAFFCCCGGLRGGLSCSLISLKDGRMSFRLTDSTALPSLMFSVSVFVELNPRADAFRGLRVRLEIIHIITGKPPQRRIAALDWRCLLVSGPSAPEGVA